MTVDDLPSRFNMVEQQIQQFSSSLGALGSEFVIKQEAERILSELNATFINSRDLAQSSLQVYMRISLTVLLGLSLFL